MSSLLKRHRWLLDLPFPVILQFITLLDIVLGDHSWWYAALAQLLILPLLLRHRYPTGVFLFVNVVALVFAIFSVGLRALLAILVAVYTVASTQERPTVLRAAALTEVVIIVASYQFVPASGGIIASIVLLTGLNLAALFLGTTVRANRLYLASLVERNRQLEFERDQEARLAASAERTRIAREMHDIVAHSLSVVVTLADGAVAASERNPEASRTAMQQVAATGRQAMTEMRRLLSVLRDGEETERTPQPNLAQLEALIEEVRSTGLEVSYTVVGKPLDLPETMQTTLYRVVQESLTNVMKHANAPTRADVSLVWREDSVTVEVRDDGRDLQPGSVAEGYGIRGIAERMALYDGEVESGPISPHGWRVRAQMRVAARES